MTAKTSDASGPATLQSILDAFNRHDLDAILSYFDHDCVCEMPRGPDPWGSRFVGRDAVCSALAGRLTGIPDVHYEDHRH